MFDGTTFVISQSSLEPDVCSKSGKYFVVFVKSSPSDIYGAIFHGDNTKPQLSDGYVTPETGNPNSYYTYFVDYYDQDGDAPLECEVEICPSSWEDTTSYEMELVSGSPANGTYSDSVYFYWGEGSYRYRFICDDGQGRLDTLPSTGWYSGPEVVEGIEEINIQLPITYQLKIYPNPFVQYCSVAPCGRSQEQVPTLQIYDLTGSLIKTTRSNTIGKELKPGIYFLKVKGPDNIEMKVIKLK